MPFETSVHEIVDESNDSDVDPAYEISKEDKREEQLDLAEDIFTPQKRVSWINFPIVFAIKIQLLFRIDIPLIIP